VSNTAVLGISTPLSDDNYYSQLSELKNENEKPLFKTLSINLICDACRKKDENAIQCVHRLASLPAWKSQKNQEKVKRIMASVPELYAREALGVTTSEKFGVFSKQQASAITRMHVEEVDTAYPIFVIIDPTGGGMSKMAMMSIGFSNGKSYIIVSMQRGTQHPGQTQKRLFRAPLPP
jgi:hypothetical protein